VQVSVTTGNPPREAHVDVSDSELRHSQDTGVIGQSLVQWDGVDGSIALNTTGLNGFDLTEGGVHNAIAVTVIANDLPANLVFTIHSGANASAVTIALPGGITTASPPVTFAAPFVAFTTLSGSGANFTSAGAIELLIDGFNDSTDVTLHDVHLTGQDWGDLPNTYRTRNGVDGPRHTAGTLFLGPTIDTSEPEGIPSIPADGDDTSASNDEDGVEPTPGVNWVSGPSGGSVNVTVTGGPGCLSAWIDWGNDGNFTEGGDNVLSNVAVSTGMNTLTFAVPSNPASGQFYARFRLYAPDTGGTCTTARSHWGPAVNGEVEDYVWGFGPNAVALQSFSAAASTAVLPVVGVGAAVVAGLVVGLRRLLRP
jgi:hypothetical protein